MSNCLPAAKVLTKQNHMPSYQQSLGIQMDNMISETSGRLSDCAMPLQDRGEQAAHPAFPGSLSFIALNWASPVSVRSVTSSCSQSCSIHDQSMSKYRAACTSVFDQSRAEVVASSHTCRAAMLNVPAPAGTEHTSIHLQHSQQWLCN